MKERYVLEALQKAVIDTAPVGLSVKYVGRVLNVGSDDKYLEVVYLPNNIENQYWGSSKVYRGSMRLILHWPIDDTGVYPALNMAKQVADNFPKGSLFEDDGSNVQVKISEEPNISTVLEQPPELIVSITVRYSYFDA